MFNPNSGAAVRRAKLMIGFMICGAWILALTVWSGVAYVASHFIAKYW